MKYHGLMFSAKSAPTDRSAGCHRIATYLRKNGLDVEVVDFTQYWSLEELQQFVRQSVTPYTLFFGFSVFFNFWSPKLQDLVNWLKKEYPHIKVIIGGQQVLFTPAENIDIWVDSYGEEAMLALTKSLAGNSSAGIKFSAEFFGKKKVIKALHTYPAYDLKDYSTLMEDRDFVQPYEWLVTEFSRGCKFACAFCNFPMLGVKEDTSRTQESFEFEMKYNYDKFGVSRYYVADETFNDRVEKIRKFADVVDRLDFEPYYSGFIRADLIPSHPEMVEELARMKFGGQYYGIETFNHESGKIIGKGLHPDKVKETLLSTKKYMSKHVAYRGTVSLIVGLPKETVDSWNQTTEWLEENWLDESIVAFPLDVEHLDEEQSQTYTNSSKFAKNLEKHGLRPMGNKKSQKYDGSYEWNWKEGNYSDKRCIWEHDTMNLYQAEELSNKFQDKVLNKFKIDSWQLGNVDFIQKKRVENLKDYINKTKINSLLIPEYYNLFLKIYIQKKLNQKK